MKRLLILALLSLYLLSACSGANNNQEANGPGRDEIVTVYKSPT
jgi:hypothetical protein